MHVANITYKNGQTFGLILSEKKYEFQSYWSDIMRNVPNTDDGYLNTIMMNSNNSSGASLNTMALTLNGHNDWFIPSIEEFTAIKKNLGRLDHTNEFFFPKQRQYWTSSASDVHHAFMFEYECRYGTYKSFKAYHKFIRPIRRFPIN